jgi:hypothetical protein
MVEQSQTKREAVFERWQVERGGLAPPSGGDGRSYERLRPTR